MSTLRARVLTGVKGIAFALIAIVPLEALIANVLLSRHTIARIASAKPESFRLTYDRARTSWPGRVHVEGLELRGRDAKVEWELHVDSADGDLSLLSFLRHKVHVSDVTARGVTFRIRFRLAPEEALADRVARIPPIDGFPPVPLFGVPPDTGDSNDEPWTIDIQGIDAQAIREVWIDTYRLAGDVHARGGFTLGEHLLAVAPGGAEVEGAALTTGADAIVTDVQGGVDARVDPVDVATLSGAAVLRYLTMNASLHGRMGGIGFIRRFVSSAPVTLEGGEGVFRSEVHLVRGLVQKGTGSHIALGPERIGIGGHRLLARATLDLATSDDEGGGTASKVDVAASDVSFFEPGAATPVARCAKLSATARLPQIDVSDALAAAGRVAYSWDAPVVEVLDLRAVDEALGSGSGLRVERGAATVGTRGHGTLAGISGENRLESSATLTVEGGRVAAGITGAVPLKVDFDAGTLDFAGAELTLRDPTRADWWGKVKVGTGLVHLEPPKATLSLAMSARDARPFLALYSGMQQTSPVAATVMRLVPDPMVESVTANLAGGARITASKGALDVHALDVRGASSRFRMEMVKRGERMEGGLLVEAGPTSVGVAFQGGTSRLILLGATSWFEGGRRAVP